MVLTFDFIHECWKTNIYPDGFENELENYLKMKQEIFSNSDLRFVNDNHMTNWLAQILTAIEIGCLKDLNRFGQFRKYWENLLGKKWKVDLETKWVIWQKD